MRRLFSFAIGVGLGATLAVLIARGFRRARRRVPQAIAGEARALFESWRQNFSNAVAEGRRAMEQREEELRQRSESSPWIGQ